MAMIEIEVPAGFADEAGDLRGAIVDLLEAAAGEAAGGETGVRTAALVELLGHVSRNPEGVAALSGFLETLTVRQSALRHVTDTIANQPVPLGSGTAGQIALVDQGWRGIESRYGALDASRYAVLVGAAPTTRSVATKAKAKGLVGYRRGRRLLFPGFQFDERGLRLGWNGIVAPLREAGWADEDIVLWLAAPHGSLGRRSPVEALDDGDRDLLLAVIEDETSGVW